MAGESNISRPEIRPSIANTARSDLPSADGADEFVDRYGVARVERPMADVADFAFRATIFRDVGPDLDGSESRAPLASIESVTCRIRFMRPLAVIAFAAPTRTSRSRRPAAGLDARYRNRHLRRRRNEDGQVDDAVLFGANSSSPSTINTAARCDWRRAGRDAPCSETSEMPAPALGAVRPTSNTCARRRHRSASAKESSSSRGTIVSARTSRDRRRLRQGWWT